MLLTITSNVLLAIIYDVLSHEANNNNNNVLSHRYLVQSYHIGIYQSYHIGRYLSVYHIGISLGNYKVWLAMVTGWSVGSTGTSINNVTNSY